MKQGLLSILLLSILAFCTGCAGETDFNAGARDSNGFSIIYSKNGAVSGDVPVNENIYQTGDTFNVPGNTGNLLKNGCTFGGWTDGASAYSEGNTYTVGSSDVTLSAVWDALKAQWAKSITSSTTPSQFYGISAVSDGSVYAAGCISGTGTVWFDDAASAAGAYSGGLNAVLVKYNSSGIGEWASTPVSGSSSSVFNSVAVASDGSVYAAGVIYGSGTYNFGNSVTVTGAYSGGYNTVIVKYNSSGVAQWASGVGSAAGESYFWGISVSSDGSVYAAGQIYGTGTYDYGSGVTAAGTYSEQNIILVKYNSSGVPQWAKSVTSGINASRFYGISVESGGSVYAAGYITGTHSYSFGNSISATGTSTYNNSVLVKYDRDGNALWAKTVTGGSSHSVFTSVSASSDGYIYAGGRLGGSGTYSFGNNVNVAGVTGDNVLVVKYSASGTTQWARSTVTGSNSSYIYGISAGEGGVFAAGYIYGAGTNSFGDNVTAAGLYSSENILLLRYDSSGKAEWAQCITEGSNLSQYNCVSTATDGSVYAAGKISGIGQFGFGNGITAAGSYYSGSNVLLVKYK